MKPKPKRLCTKCSTEYSVCGFDRHFKSCNGELNYWTKKAKGLLVVDNETVCKFCNKVCKNPNSQRNHSRLCKLNPEKQNTYFATNQEEINELKKANGVSNHYTKAKSLGLPPPQITEETRSKLSSNAKNKTKEEREASARKASKTIRKKVEDGTWHTSLAKDMHYEYNGVDLHGKWELNYAMWLDINNVKWERCSRSFDYIFEGKCRKYTPDFFLTDQNVYVEIKGYKTKKDEAKWNQFPADYFLQILLKEDLIKLGIDVN